MSQATNLVPKITIGLDLGDRTSRTYELATNGECLREETIGTSVKHLERYFGNRAPCRVVLEVGTHSPWVSRRLEQLGHEVVVANSCEVFSGRRRKKKNDRIDAEFLARQGRVDVRLLYPVRHRSREAARDLEILRARDQVVRLRTGLINHVRGAVKSTGQRITKCSAEAFAKRAGGEMPEDLREILNPLLEVIQDLTSRIRSYDQQIRGVISRTPVAERLQQPAGVGPLTALGFVLLIEEPRRFSRSRDVGAYFGLVPRLGESSGRSPQLRISKAGDEMGRRLLVSAAQYVLGPFGPACDLRRYGEALAARGGKNGKKRAVVAVARKLAVMLHRLWLTGEKYDPNHQLNAKKVA